MELAFFVLAILLTILSAAMWFAVIMTLIILLAFSALATYFAPRIWPDEVR